MVPRDRDRGRSQHNPVVKKEVKGQEAEQHAAGKGDKCYLHVVRRDESRLDRALRGGQPVVPHLVALPQLLHLA